MCYNEKKTTCLERIFTMPQMKFIPSTEKCRISDSYADKTAIARLAMLRNEKIHLQVALFEEDPNITVRAFSLVIDSPLAPFVKVYRIEQVPVKMPIYRGVTDPDFLSKEPGLYPDLLLPYDIQPRLYFCGGEVRSLYLTVEDKEGIAPGEYDLTLKAMAGDDCFATASIKIEVVSALLAEQTLIYTSWFHSDCLAQFYDVPVFSEEYWRIVRNFVRAAVDDGQNMILTPVFTPPLDTAVGGERLTVQLVDVTVDGAGNYTFGFDDLDRFVKMAQEEGMKYFEISHLFTQWGCAHAPKIMANTPEGYRRLWGWETDAHSSEYKTFLRAFLTAFLAHAKTLGIDGQCYFHISDEPSRKHLDAYLDAKNAICDLLEGYTIMDALSDFDFYKTGAIQCPIPATNHITPFLQAGIEGLWTYYCCSQYVEVSNRFLAMPGYRTRILGTQLFKYKISGFLHWGFNFYNCGGSNYAVDPYLDTTADYMVPAGDAFVVYPAPDGTAWPTLHGQHFAQSLTDLRLMQTCASIIGFDATIALMEEDIDPITFFSYPRSHAYLTDLHERLIAAIKANL